MKKGKAPHRLCDARGPAADAPMPSILNCCRADTATGKFPLDTLEAWTGSQYRKGGAIRYLKKRQMM